MGFVNKAVKKVRKIGEKIGLAGLPKAVKRIARKVKTLGANVWKGVQKVFKPIGRAFAKLGPIGTIALSFVLPGIGTMLGSMWTAASAYLPTAFVQAVNTGIGYVSNAMSAAKGFVSKAIGKVGETSLGQTVSKAYGSITDKISSAFEYVGGSVKEGATNLFTKAKEFIGMETPPSDGGAFIGKGAENMMVDKAVAANPEFVKMANASGTTVADIARSNPSTFIGSDVVGPMSTTQSFNAMQNPELAGKAGGTVLDQQSSFLTQKTGQDALAANPEFLRMGGGNVNTATDLANQQSNYLEATRGVESAATFTGVQAPEPVSTGTLGAPSTIEKILKGAASSLSSAQPQQPTLQPYVPQFAAGDISNTQTNRFGVGGQGSAGGQFLDPTILAMIQAQSKQLEALG